MRRKFKRKQGPVRSKKVTVDGIQFASGLEKYMYLALKEAKIEARYEGETYVLPSYLAFILAFFKAKYIYFSRPEAN